ncbi:Gldg family protein [Chitinophaga sp. 212800010-3]|uniref:Gldg family protein n=1 Tax=unclassified Chitinophaga TaxID=2619133 RepID=UPI002DE6B28F|nr:ABC-transp-aux domain-containing protein [Chitinophaga sp. 212800010-3]
MKMIFKIAKTELRNLFYSPVAWFLTIAFMVQSGFYYSRELLNLAKWQDIALKNNPQFKDWGVPLTPGIFLGGDGIFSNALQNLYLFVPLLTMGLISREINNGTIKLLYSSPVKTREIVFGKYLAIMLYNFMLVSIVGIFMMMGMVQIKSADYGMLLSAALGFYLLVCTYTAIGLFMSSLTNYQIVSAIGSFIIIFILGRIGGLWQKYDFVRDLTYFLSISGRTVKMLRGLITTADVIYFLMIIFMFVSFTLIKLKAGRESKSWLIRVSRYIVVVVIVLATGYFSSRPAFIGYWDTTARKINTLHPNTQQIIKEMGNGPLEVTLYTNLLGGGAIKGFPENRNDYLWNLWEPYLRFKPDIKFNYVYYYDTDDNDSTLYKMWPGKNLEQIAKQMAEGFELNPSMFKAPAEVRKMINLQPERYRVVMEVKYNGRRTFLRTFDDPTFWPEELQVAPALKRLLQAKMPKLTFLTGNLERDIYKKGEREYYGLTQNKAEREALINIGFDSDSLSGETHEIPDSIATLVLADPKTELSPAKKENIRRYLDRGGNMMLLGEPGKQQILNPVLQQLGIQLEEGTLVELSKDEMPHMIKPYITRAATYLAGSGFFTDLRTMMEQGDTIPQLMPGAAPITILDSSKYKTEALLTTFNGRDWLKKGALVVDSAAPVFSPQEGDTRAVSYATAVSLTRQAGNRQQRIIVMGDADFMSSLRQGGGAMSKAMFSWLDYGAFPIYTPKPKPVDTLLRISPAGANTVKWLFVWILPALVALAGTILLIRRKRQ